MLSALDKGLGFRLVLLTGSLALVVGATASISEAAGLTVRPVVAAGRVVPALLRPDVIGGLTHIVTIGSTVDPLNGDQNPYGLTIATGTGGKIASGDLVICNFNDKDNIQGLGTTIEVLKPVAGSKPVRLSADAHLTGCDALALSTGGTFPWIAAYDANDAPIVSDTGAIVDPLNTFPWQLPFGETFVGGGASTAAFYTSNADDGSIVRVNLGATFTFDKIITGFRVNHGVPGTILGPSGLTYDPKTDNLYIVDGDANTVYTINAPGKIKAGGIHVTPTGFTGPSASSASILFSGAPLNAPISSALLFNGDLVVGNTFDNFLIEIAPNHKVVGKKKLDTGVVGAIFGIVATGTSALTTKVYFNDDNDNTVKVLEH